MGRTATESVGSLQDRVTRTGRLALRPGPATFSLAQPSSSSSLSSVARPRYTGSWDADGSVPFSSRYTSLVEVEEIQCHDTLRSATETDGSGSNQQPITTSPPNSDWYRPCSGSTVNRAETRAQPDPGQLSLEIGGDLVFCAGRVPERHGIRTCRTTTARVRSMETCATDKSLS